VNPQASAVRLGLYGAVLVPLTFLGTPGIALANVLATFAANLMRALSCRRVLKLPAAV